MTAATDIKERLRDMQSKKYNPTWATWVQTQTSAAVDYIEQLEHDTAALQARIAELEAMVAAQAGQEPVNPYPSGLPAENWRRGYNGEQFIGYAGSAAEKFYNKGKKARQERTTPPAPASAIAIVQAAIEAAAKVCEQHAASLDNDWNKTLGVANDLAAVAIDCGTDIRAIDKQAILYEASK